MLDPNHALAAAARTPPPTAAAAQRVLVIGGAGALGSAVLEQLLGTHRFERVGVVVVRPVSPALRGLLTVQGNDAALQAFAADTAVVVFDRERHANGRDDAFERPQPEGLAPLATRLYGRGVRRLIVAVPHAPSMLPLALQRGLASLDEGAVAALGFEQLVFLRLAQAGGAGAGELSPPQRLARWMLGQLHWMVPQSQQPVRVATVAKVVAALVQQLPGGTAGTRVLPPELLWHAAHVKDAEPLVERWLAGETLPDLQALRQRW
jgi:hypothetical protein